MEWLNLSTTLGNLRRDRRLFSRQGEPASAPPHVGDSKLLLGEGTRVDVKCLCGHEPETS